MGERCHVDSREVVAARRAVRAAAGAGANRGKPGGLVGLVEVEDDVAREREDAARIVGVFAEVAEVPCRAAGGVDRPELALPVAADEHLAASEDPWRGEGQGE